MTQEEKAKAYDDALERAKDCLADGTITNTAKSYIEAIFPELKESEDERIRKFLHHTFTAQYLAQDKLGKWHGEPVSNILAWLEKQKPSDAALEYLKENHSPSEVSDFQAAMNIAVAKAYDRGRADAIKQDPCRTCDRPTMSCNNFPCEKKQCEHNSEEPHWVHHKVDLSGCSKEYIAAYYDGWNNCNMQHSQRQAEQKPTEWSEEDERLRTSCIKHIEEELEEIRNDKYGHSEIISDLKESCRERINWLKSLKPQPHWKPTDEQMADLWNMVCECRPADQQLLQDIYYGLKTLKEE